MKSRHLPAMHTSTHRRYWRSLPWLVALLLLLWSAAAAFAQQQDPADPPSRVANLSYRHGGVVFAPEGEEEWVELPQNRPLTSGDRVWSDHGARAELHLGAATLHIDGESHLGITALDDRAAQFILMQGTVNARVRELAPGENFEIGTPNLAFRVTQPGDFRIDVDGDGTQTRVVVLSGMATLYGEGGEAIHLAQGQQASFAGRYLARVHGTPFQGDEFAQWSGERNRAEDQSIAARHVPRGVVGYQQLDQHGTWGQDPTHGAVWYPRVTVADWAPYRYGHWSWVQPWGWTWVDDAPWGFAPFHYGRWAQIGSRWAWVPGRMAARPVYSPALVVFMGAGPGVGWYPLGPGEAWYPTYRTTPRYVGFANFSINLGAYPRHYGGHMHRYRTHAVTAVREDDFRSGRNVRHHWRALQSSVIAQANFGLVPARPDWRFQREGFGVAPRLQVAPRTSVQPALPSRFWGQGREGWDRARQQREWSDRHEQRFEGRREQQVAPQPARHGAQLEQAVREQVQAQREQQRLQMDAERNAREQQRQQAEQARRGMQEQQARQQQEALRQQQESFRQQQQVREQQQRSGREAWQRRGLEPGTIQAQPHQPAAPIGRAPERIERGDRGDRGDFRMRGGDRGERGGGRWQRDDDGGGRGRGGDGGGRGHGGDGRGWQR